jgi:mono/diheme cytochrome c family protein
MTMLPLAAVSAVLAAAAPVSAPGVDAGAHLAALHCASCHAVGPDGRSPNVAAPPFRDIRLRYNGLSLERELGRISKQGHFEMRPTAIRADEAHDLAEYIESLAPPKP